MAAERSGLRVAVVGTNDPRNVSGGRYHAAMLAYAVAATGGQAHFVTDHVPGFLPDLEPLAPGGVRVWQTPDFVSGLPEGGLDWLVVIPTGIFHPAFYESCLDFAGRSGARIALVNFESANWFNAAAPEPRDPRLWDYWRRVCLHGGLVLCSARVSLDWARSFYSAPEGYIRFEVWSPPINSVAAQNFDGLAKDGSIVAFIRPQDLHKGSGLLTELDPALFEGRTLRLISGRDVPRDYRQLVERHLKQSRDATLDIALRVSDLHKFRVLTSAQAVLFPSRFEGYGYPPVEAAYAGSESVCFDLPVLRETMGDVAHFAPTLELAGFEAALRAALAAPERRSELRSAVYDRVDFHEAALRLSEILTRSADRVKAAQPRPSRVLLGPLAKAAPRPSSDVDRDADLGSFPPYVLEAVTTTAGELLLTARALLPAGIDGFTAATAGGTPLPVFWTGRATSTGYLDARFFLLAPQDATGHRLIVQPLRAGAPGASEIELVIERAGPANSLRPAMCGVSENTVLEDSRRLRGWIMAREPVTSVALAPTGTTWLQIEVKGERRDLGVKHPSYGTSRCEFRADVPLSAEPDRQRALLFCLAGPPGQERAVDALSGWSPVPKPFFTGSARYVDTAVKPEANTKPAERHDAAAAGGLPTGKKLGTLRILDKTDAAWRRGFARIGLPGRLAAILVGKSGDVQQVGRGTVLAFGDGSARRVLTVETRDAEVEIVLDGPLGSAGLGAGAADIFDPADSATAPRTLVIHAWSDERWWRGIWNKQDHRFRRGFSTKIAQAEQVGIATGAKLRFAASGVRTVTSHEDDTFGNRRIWLDGDIRPLADGQPNAVEVLVPATSTLGGIGFSEARDGQGWTAGVLAEHDGTLQPGRAVLLATPAASVVSAGVVLRFTDGTLRRVLSAEPQSGALRVVLDGVVDPRVHGAPATVTVANPIDFAGRLPAPYRYPHPDLPAKDPLFFTMAAHARQRGDALPATSAASPEPARVLVLSAVSPSPANQGNRVVTRNLIRHFVECGYECDVIVQNWVDAAAATQEFGPGVRFISVPFPAWNSSQSVTSRARIAEMARGLADYEFDAEFGAAIADNAENFHPYFIVRDETVDVARTLYAATQYAAVVCNYTHMLRVAEELRDIRPLPPVAVITHDALSRLPASVNGRKLDRMFRACPPATECQVLDAVDGAVVVAISRSEADYFAELGVTNRIVITEYDATSEMAPYRSGADAFARRTILFHGSSNPMNIAGMDWFVDECWATVLSAVPDAKLVVCGNIGAKWSPGVPGIEVTGELTREEMLRLCSQASITINPCVAGTGLKIKTVEAVCLGLPTVCLPTAVDGLEDVADQFAIVAQDGAQFAAACIRLLTDQAAWAELRNRALTVAEQRFSPSVVYHALDAAMGWPPSARTDGQRSRKAAKVMLPPLAAAIRRLETEPENDPALLALGRQLIRTGQVDVGASMIARVAARQKTEPAVLRIAALAELARDEHWQAAFHAGSVIASNPLSAQGYLLFGRAMLGCNRPHEAIQALHQGMLVAARHPHLLATLIEAYERADDAKMRRRWLRRDRSLPSLGEYLSAAVLHSRGALANFEFDEISQRTFVPRSGRIALHLPEVLDKDLLVAIDVRVSRNATIDPKLVLWTKYDEVETQLRSKSSEVQTLKLRVNAGCCDDGDALILGLANSGLGEPSAPIELIGVIIQEYREENASGRPH